MIFLRDIKCLTRIQLILKLLEKASSSKINFQKAKPCGLGHIKIGLINFEKCYGQIFLMKYLECILVILSLITTTGTRQMTNKS